jgi:hypothetical protein
MEFKIFHCIFCEEYQLQPNAFPFDEYVLKTLEEMLTEMVELKPLDWLFILILVFLNWFRVWLKLEIFDCPALSSSETHRRQLAGGGSSIITTYCEGRASIIAFSYVGSFNHHIHLLILI